MFYEQPVQIPRHDQWIPLSGSGLLRQTEFAHTIPNGIDTDVSLADESQLCLFVNDIEQLTRSGLRILIYSHVREVIQSLRRNGWY